MSAGGPRPSPSPSGRRWPLWGVALLWASLAAACLTLLIEVNRVRDDLARGVDWLRSADRVHEELDALALPSAGGRPPTPRPGLEDQLQSATLVRSAPLPPDEVRAHLERFEPAAAALRDLLLPPPGRAPAPGPRLLAEAHARLDGVLGGLRSSVRARQSDLTQRMTSLWTRLFVLASACVVGVGLLSWLLLRHAAQTRALSASQQALLASEGRFRTLVQTSQDLIWSVDAQGRWTFVNEAARRIYGRDPAQMLGRPFREVLAAERVEPDLAAFAEILGGRTLLQHETVHLHADGRRIHLLFNATAMRDPAGRVIGTTGTASDVSDLTELRDRVRHTDRLQALGTLAGGVAHDFNNLLTGVIGNAGFAREDRDDPERLLKDLDAIESIAQRGRTLTRQLLAFARKQVLKPETIDLCRVALEQQDFLRRLLGEEITLRTEAPGHPLWVRADRTQVEQVLMNLCVNARDALKEGLGRITVALGVLEVGGDEARSLGIAPGTWVRLDVEDDGVGMDEATRRRLFEPFFTTKPDGQGTGLGLSTVYGIVHQHGGTITCSSSPGRGTLMRVLLQPCEAPALAPATPGRPSEPVAGHGLRVLVVEDDPLVREVVQRVLEGAHFEVESPLDPLRALESVGEGRRAPDLLVTDVRMPGLSGPQLAARLRTLFPELPVLFISGYAGRELPPRWLDQVSTHFLRKPFTPLELLGAVGVLRHRTTGVRPGRARPR